MYRREHDEDLHFLVLAPLLNPQLLPQSSWRLPGISRRLAEVQNTLRVLLHQMYRLD